MVPNLFKTYAHHPPLLQANWNKVKAVMMEGSLTRKVKQTIAVLVSRDNSCSYCVAAPTGALRSIGVTDDEISAIEEDPGSSGEGIAGACKESDREATNGQRHHRFAGTHAWSRRKWEERSSKEFSVIDLTGMPAAPFEHRDSEGRSHRLETYRGSWLLLVFHRHLG